MLVVGSSNGSLCASPSASPLLSFCLSHSLYLSTKFGGIVASRRTNRSHYKQQSHTVSVSKQSNFSLGALSHTHTYYLHNTQQTQSLAKKKPCCTHWRLLILGSDACTFTPSLWLERAEWGALLDASVFLIIS